MERKMSAEAVLDDLAQVYSNDLENLRRTHLKVLRIMREYRSATDRWPCAKEIEERYGSIAVYDILEEMLRFGWVEREESKESGRRYMRYRPTKVGETLAILSQGLLERYREEAVRRLLEELRPGIKSLSVLPSRRDEAEKLVLQKMDEADSRITLLEYCKLGDEHLLPDVKEPEVKVEKLPWIGYRFYCANPKCRGHEMMVIDWEAQELFRKYKTIEGPVKKKLFVEMTTMRDLYFVVGNTWRYYKSFMVISLFYPPRGTKPVPPLRPIFRKKPTLEKYLQRC